MGRASDLQRAGGRAQLCPRDGASDRQEPGQGPRRSNILKTTIDVTKEVATAIIDFARSFDFIDKALTDYINNWKTIFNLFSQAPQFLQGLSNAFVEAFRQISNIFTNTVDSIRLGLEGIFSLDFEKVKQAVKKDKEGYSKAGKEIAKAFKKGFEETAPISTAIKKDSEKAVKELENANKELSKNEINLIKSFTS